MTISPINYRDTEPAGVMNISVANFMILHQSFIDVNAEPVNLTIPFGWSMLSVNRFTILPNRVHA